MIIQDGTFTNAFTTTTTIAEFEWLGVQGSNALKPEEGGIIVSQKSISSLFVQKKLLCSGPENVHFLGSYNSQKS